MRAKLQLTITPWSGWRPKNPDSPKPEPIIVTLDSEIGYLTREKLGPGFIYSQNIEISEISPDSVTLKAHGCFPENNKSENAGKISWFKDDSGSPVTEIILQPKQQAEFTTDSHDAGTGFLVNLLEIY